MVHASYPFSLFSFVLCGQSSFVSEEVSEEYPVNSSCSCQHDPALGGGSSTTGAMVEHEQQQPLLQEERGERETGSSIEVRNRLDELQERNSTLEQEKVRVSAARSKCWCFGRSTLVAAASGCSARSLYAMIDCR